MSLSLFRGKKPSFYLTQWIPFIDTVLRAQEIPVCWSLLVNFQGDAADHFYQKSKTEQFLNAFECVDTSYVSILSDCLTLNNIRLGLMFYIALISLSINIY